MKLRPPKHLTEAIIIVVINAVVYAYQWSLTPLERGRFNIDHGAIPTIMIDAWGMFLRWGPRPEVLAWGLPLITANWLHRDVGHVLGNMLFFWVFANMLVPIVGRPLFVILYVLGGAIAITIYVVTNPTGEYAMIGASGAVAALEGAYFTLVIRWHIPDGEVWPFTERSLRPRVVAFLAAGNFLIDARSFLSGVREEVAVGAHVGGFLGGIAMALIVSMKKTPKLKPT